MRNPFIFKASNPLAWKVPFPHLLAWRLRLPSFPKVRNPFLIRRTVGQWIAWFLIAFLIIASIALFFAYVDPSLKGTNGLRLWADSGIYLWVAGMIPNNPYGANSDPYPGLLTVAGNYLGPVLIARTLHSNFLIACFNYALFFLAIWFCSKAKPIRVAMFTALLILNPMIFISLLTVNKEILAILGAAMLFYYVAHGRKGIVLPSVMLLVSLLARWEQALVTLLFLALTAEWSPFRTRRALLLLLLIAGLTVAAPHIGESMNDMIENKGNTIAFLTNLQRNYLYFLVVVPKICLDLYGMLIHSFTTNDLDAGDIYNKVLMPITAALNLALTFWFLLRRRLSLSNDFQFFAVFFALLFAIAPVSQVRYFVPVYVVLCLEVAARESPYGRSCVATANDS